MESCAFKTVLSAGAGFGLGAFFSLVSSSFAFDDPLSRQSELSRQQKAKQLFSDMGKSMYRQGKGFGAVGGLFAGIECCIEGVRGKIQIKCNTINNYVQYRAKNDMYNSASAGFISGSILSRSAGVKAAFGGGFAFAAFSTAIDWYMRSPVCLANF